MSKRSCFAWWLATLVLAGADGPKLVLPPLAGELSGDFTPRKFAGAPTLHWTLVLENPAPFERVASLSAVGPGVLLHAEARLDAAGNGSWRVTEGRVELQPWLGVQLTTGTVGLTGEGTLRDGVLAGEWLLHPVGVDLGELLRFSDADKKYFGSAEGRVEGTIRVMGRGETFTVREAALTLAVGPAALVTFRPSPGLLTSYVPATVRKRYPGLEAIEMGQTPLEARVLRLTYAAAPDAAGRVGVLRIEGQPHDRKYIAPLELDINISGAVENLLRKVLDRRLHLAPPK